MTKIIRILFHIFACFILLMMNSTFFVALAQDQVSFSSELLGIEGIWEGKLKVPGTELRIIFRITKTPEGNLTATMDSPDQGVTGIPVDAVMLQDNSFSIEIKAIAGIYEGIISQDYTEIEGDWKQAGASFPLLLQKVEKSVEISRPQEPKRLFPYIEEEVKYENREAGIVLAGTLTLPDEESLFPDL